MTSIKWDPQIKFILSDVDETIADVYMPANKKLIKNLELLLSGGIKLFLISGGGLQSISERVAYFIKPNLRKNILISHCSGAEVWGFKDNGDLKDKPYYSIYDEKISENQKIAWRNVVNQIIDEFKLKIYSTMPVKEFKEITKEDPLSVMLSDRGPQITLEVVNAYDLTEEKVKTLPFDVPQTHGFYDARVVIANRALQLFEKESLPIDARLEGVFAINFPIKGVSKQTSIEFVIKSEEIMKSINLKRDIIDVPEHVEIWGDKFSELRAKHDSLMSRSVNPKSRSIDFRQENPEEVPKGYNIVIWDGKKHLHEGLLEYLTSKNETGKE